MKPSDWAWVALGVGVLGYDILCPEGDTMSEAADRYMLRHPWLVRVVAFALAAHVANAVHPRYDVVHVVFVNLRRTRL